MRAASALASLLLAHALAAQDAELDSAIARLGGERLDCEALVTLIDGGADAMDPLLDALEAELDATQDTARALRILRVCRALGPVAAARSPRLMEIFATHAFETGTPAELRDAMIFTLTRLAWLAPQQLPELRENFTEHFKGGESLMGGAARTMATITGRHRLLRRLAIASGLGHFPVSLSPTDFVSLSSTDLMDRELAAELAERRDSSVVPNLVKLLRDDDQPRLSKFRLGGLGSAIEVPGPMAASIVHEAAARSLARLAPDHPEAVRGLCILVHSAEDPRERAAAMAAIGRRGDALRHDEDVLDTLEAALANDSNRELLAESITACGTLSVPLDQFRERLDALAADPRPELAARAKAVLDRPRSRR